MNPASPFELRCAARWLRRVIGLVVATLALAHCGQAAATKLSFDLPEDSAEKSLKRFSEQAGREVLFASDITRGIRTNSVKGEMPPHEAIDRLLANTGLVAVHEAEEGAYSVRKETPEEAKNGERAARNDRRVRPEATGEKGGGNGVLAGTQPRSANAAPSKAVAVTLSVFEVRGDKDEGYRSTQTLSGSSTLANLRDTPNSISVMNRDLIEDLNATNMGDLSRFSITGETNTNTEGLATNGNFVFRGMVSAVQLRNGVFWGAPLDTYNIDRVEVLRGPTAFLYGEGSPGGLMNQLTKQALFTDFKKVTLMAGSYGLYRVELDVNQKLNDKLAIRTMGAFEDGGTFQDYAGRNFKGADLAMTYRPFQNTTVKLNFEAARSHRIMIANMLADVYSTTLRTGTTTAYAAGNGGNTLLPATGQIYNTVGTRRSAGSNIVVSDEKLLPRESNLLGPDAFNRQYYTAINFQVDQRVSENFNVQASAALQNISTKLRNKGGALATGIAIDTNTTLPGGAANPYFNQYYTEFYHQILYNASRVHFGRITAVYDLKLPFTTQRIVANATHYDNTPNTKTYSEVVDPGSPQFTGTLNSASTLAAYQANRTVLSQNYFYRRFYLRDGDRADLTRGGVVPGRSAIVRDTFVDGGAGRLTDRLYKGPSYGMGASGSYFNERVHTLVGWRHDSFIQDPTNDFYNSATGETYRLATTAPVHTDISEHSINYGGVVQIFPFVAAYFNYAQSVALSSGIGAPGLVPNTVRGPLIGDGYEYGLRWTFLGGRLESNWTGYVTNALRNPAALAAGVGAELGAIFTDITPTGVDTQTTKATGVEFETVANLSKNWRLIWNYSTNDLETSERYPQLHSFQDKAKGLGKPTPLTDAFLNTVPEGTPLPGFTKVRSNLVTNYRIETGLLKNISLGGGAQYREKSYQGNFDLNLDGTAEQLWAPGYLVWNLMLGYRTRLFNRVVNFNLNVNNIFDRAYYRSLGLATGGWGEERSFRLSARFNL